MSYWTGTTAPPRFQIRQGEGHVILNWYYGATKISNFKVRVMSYWTGTTAPPRFQTHQGEGHVILNWCYGATKISNSSRWGSCHTELVLRRHQDFKLIKVRVIMSYGPDFYSAFSELLADSQHWLAAFFSRNLIGPFCDHGTKVHFLFIWICLVWKKNCHIKSENHVVITCTFNQSSFNKPVGGQN